MKNKKIKIIALLFVLAVVASSFFWDNISNQLAQVSGLTISSRSIISEVIEIKDLSKLNNIINKTTFINSTVKDSFISETRKAVNSGVEVTLHFSVSKNENTIGKYNSGGSSKNLSGNIIIGSRPGKYEQRIITITTEYPDPMTAKAPTISLVLKSAVVATSSNDSGSGSNDSGSGSSSGGYTGGTVTPPVKTRNYTPNLNRNGGICYLLSSGYSILDRLNTTPPSSYPNIKFTSPADKNSKFWNHNWLEKFAGEIKSGDYVNDTGVIDLYKRFLKTTVTLEKKPLKMDKNDWLRIAASLESKKSDCTFIITGHASYVESMSVKPDGKKVLTIINTLEQGFKKEFPTGRSDMSDLGHHLYPPYRPTQTTFTINADGSIASVVTTKLNSQVSDELAEVTRKFWERESKDAGSVNGKPTDTGNWDIRCFTPVKK